MLHLGCHLSMAKGFYAMGLDGQGVGADTFQFFLRNPRGGRSRAFDPGDMARLRALLKEGDFAPVAAHAPYTFNPCSPKKDLRDYARVDMAEDLARMEHLPGNLYVFHPGAHGGQGAEKGIELVAELLNAILIREQTTTVLLETMSGKGTEIGWRFEELRAILDRVERREMMGVCLDTCHVFSAGYDIRDAHEAVLEEFDRVVGLSRLKAVHLNDSGHPLGSRKDAHRKLGEGNIGLEALVRVARHPSLRGLPFILETPNDLPGFGLEIGLFKKALATA